MTASLPDALCTVLDDPEASALRVRCPDGPGGALSRAAAVALVPAVVQRLPADLSDSALIAAAHRFGFRGLPISLTLSGDRAVVVTWHAVADGSVDLDLVHRLVELAVGSPARSWPRPVSFPVARALLRAGVLRSLRAYRGWRAEERSTPTVLAPLPTPEQSRRENARSLHRRLTAEELDRMRAGASPGGTQFSRLAAVAARALQDGYRGQGDPCLIIPIGLRQWVRGHVDGNFFWTLRLGGLVSRRWTEEQVRELVRRASGPLGVGGLAAVLIAVLRHRVGGRLRGRSADAVARQELTAQISSIRSPCPFPPAAFSGEPRLSFALTGPWPVSMFVMLWRLEDDVHVSIWDETDLLDLDRVMAVLEDAVPAGK